MKTRCKLLIAVFICLGLFVGIFYAGSSVGSWRTDQKIKETEAEVNRLKGERDSLETVWASKERDFEEQIKGLNSRLAKLQRDFNERENRIREYERQRENIVIPDSAGGIANEFRKRGIKSAVACPKPKPKSK